MADVEHKVLTEDVFDGTTGQKTGESRLHALGITVNGVFVPFLTKTDDYIQRKVADAKAAAGSQPDQAQGDTGLPQASGVPTADDQA